MKKILLVLLVVLSTYFIQAQDNLYGTFYGIQAQVYKSNLFNSDDLRTDSFQTYSFTPGFGLQLEYGYLYESGFSISGGLQIATNSQKYKGTHSFYLYDLNATTTMTLIKIPLIMSKQAINEKKMKFIYSWGFYLGFNAGTKDHVTWDFKDPKAIDYEIDITKNTYTAGYVGDSVKSTWDLKKSPYRSMGFGALGAIGATYRIGKKTDFIAQARGDFMLSNIERTDEIEYTPTGKTAQFEKSKLDHPFGNYAKWMTSGNLNHNRSATHPFTLGLTLGIRHYIFDFD
ncbi:MAG: hypothetical protein R2831_12145 [Chitinophagaceae bacterium]